MDFQFGREFLLPVFTTTPSKNKFETVQYQKLRILSVTKDYQINNFAKSQVRAVHRS